MCRDPEPFDWYQRYSGIRDLINQYVRREDNILMSGAGNSRKSLHGLSVSQNAHLTIGLTEDMFEDGKRQHKPSSEEL